jgi:uncharacterized membrane protein
METPITVDKFRFLLYRLKEKLWIKPLLLCLLSIACVFAAKTADSFLDSKHIPDINAESVETLLSIMASTMMVIATFSAGTMVNAYSSAGHSSTPRSLSLIISDDVSQYALSVFVGAFIYSAVAITAMHLAFFDTAGIFILFCLTCTVFVVVILTFIRWVDSVARLGRVESTVLKVEHATKRAIEHRIKTPYLGAIPQHDAAVQGSHAIYTDEVGYIQLVDIARLQQLCEKEDLFINLNMLPGEFVTPERPVGFATEAGFDKEILCAISIDPMRSFEADPRYGFIVLAEIASRALSPAVNDHGTAIKIITSITRLLLLWHSTERVNKTDSQNNSHEPKYNRVSVPELSINDIFDDAFTSISRDSNNNIEVAIRIQKSLITLSKCFEHVDKEFYKAAVKFQKETFDRCFENLSFEKDRERLNLVFEESK